MIYVVAQVASLFTAPALAGAGALLVAIPVAIHLWSRFRRRRQAWGAMRFVWEAFQKQRRRLQMEQLILLAVRCLLVFTLGLALAGPVLSGCSEQFRVMGLVEPSGRTVHVILDDSLATAAVDPATGRPRFEAVRELAQRAASESAGDRVRYWPMSRGAATPEVGTNAQQALPESPGFAPADLTGTLARVAEAIAAEGSTGDRQDVVLLASPLWSGVVGDAAAAPEAWDAAHGKARLLVARPAAAVSNLQVVDAQPRRRVVVASAASGEGRATVPVTARVRRIDALDTGMNATLRVQVLDADGRVLGEATRDLAFAAGPSEQAVNLDVAVEGLPGADASGAAPRVPAAIRASLEGVDAVTDALAADGERWATVELRPSLRVAVVDEPGDAPPGALWPARWAALALSPRGGGAVNVVDVAPAALQAEEGALAGFDAAVVLRPDLVGDRTWNRLAAFAEAGGLVWVTAPAIERSAGGWTRGMRDAFDLDWRLGVEPEATGGGGEDGVALALDRSAPETLELLSGDWEALLRPVRVTRWVPTAAPADDTWLTLPNVPGTREGQASALLAYHPHGAGGLLFLSAALDAAWTNLPTKPLFVPLVHEAVRGSIGGGAGEALVIGHGAPPDGARRTLPVEPAGNAALLPGVYVPREGGAAPLAANVDPAAGVTTAVDEVALARFLDTLGEWAYVDADGLGDALRGEGERGPNLGWALLWLVLALVVTETVLARLFSHAKDSGNRGLAAGVWERVKRMSVAQRGAEGRRAA